MQNQIFSKQFSIEPFPANFNIIAYDNNESFINYCINEGIKLDFDTFPSSECAYVFSKGISIYIVFYIPLLENIGLICHEAIHVVDKMFQAIGQPAHNINDDELIPHYTEYIVNQIVDFLIENKILSLTLNKTEENEK